MPPDIGTDGGLLEGEAFAGLWASLSSRAAAYSAKEPRLIPNTSSPTANLVTAEPTATTVPATSSPGTAVLRSAQAEHQSRISVRRAGHQVPGAAVESGRVHPHQHLAVGDRGSVICARRSTSAEP